MRSPTGKAWLGVAAGLTVAMVASGCSDGAGRAGTLPSPTATPTTTSASPTPTPTTPEAQIEAAVRAFFAEVTRASKTRETSRLKTMSTTGCPCSAYARVFDKLRRDNVRMVGAAWTVEKVVVSHVTETTGSAEVLYSVTAHKVVNRQGEVLERYAADRGHYSYGLVLTDSGWVLGSALALEVH